MELDLVDCVPLPSSDHFARLLVSVRLLHLFFVIDLIDGMLITLTVSLRLSPRVRLFNLLDSRNLLSKVSHTGTLATLS